MAVLFVNKNTMAPAANAASAGGNFNVTASGTNQVATADLAWDGANGLSVSAVTLGGSSMAALGAADQNTSNNAYAQGFWKASPTTGATVALAITMSATCTDIYFDVTVVSGADQTTQPRPGTYQAPANPVANASGVLTLTVSSNANDITKTIINSGAIGAPTTNQGTPAGTADGTSTSGTFGGGCDHCTTPAASVSHTWSGLGANATVAIVGFSIQAAGGTAVSTSPLPPMPYALDITRNPIARAIKNLLAYSTVNPAAPVVSSILQCRTLNEFGSHAGGRTMRGDS